MVNKRFPKSVMSVSRAEFGNENPQAKAPRLSLNVSGQLPADIQGHVYIVGPAGSVDSPKTDRDTVTPYQDGTTLLYNGDGMIYRVDFDQPIAGAFMTSRLIKPPCYYADVATQLDPKFQGSATCSDLRFKSFGVARLGKLGMRNQLNTALLPMKFAQDDCERLMVTWDAGRPYEIDPATLETVTPIGWNDEWKPVTHVEHLPWQPPAPFKTVQTSAHPVFDPLRNGGEVITVNLGRSFSTTLSQFVPIRLVVKRLLRLKLWQLKHLIIKSPKADKPSLLTNLWVMRDTLSQIRRGLRDFFQTIFHKFTVWNGQRFLQDLISILWRIISGCLTFFRGNFVDLVLWDGTNDFKKWTVCYQGKPLIIRQSTHQIGVTQDYIILLDTAFKISIAGLLPSQKTENSYRLLTWLRKLLDHPQIHDNHLYIVRRSDLKKGTTCVQAQKIVLPMESAHFLVNYQNPDNQITLHFSHVCAWDAAECLTVFDDIQTNQTSNPSPYGIIYSPTDVSRLSCCTLKIKENEIEIVRPQTLDVVMDHQLTWGPALYTYRNTATYAPPEQIENIYWSCMGCWKELLKPHIENLYQDYPYREISLEELKTISQVGRASSLIRLKITPLEKASPNTSRIVIADAFQFTETMTIGTPQFIPAKNSTGSHEGYIFCIVHDSQGQTNSNEIWIFDASDLKQGPLCKLWHPEMNFGFTVHSTWLQQATGRKASYNIPMEQDYKAVVEHPYQSPEVRELFEDWIFKKRDIDEATSLDTPSQVAHAGK